MKIGLFAAFRSANISSRICRARPERGSKAIRCELRHRRAGQPRAKCRSMHCLHGQRMTCYVCHSQAWAFACFGLHVSFCRALSALSRIRSALHPHLLNIRTPCHIAILSPASTLHTRRERTCSQSPSQELGQNCVHARVRTMRTAVARSPLSTAWTPARNQSTVSPLSKAHTPAT